MFSLGLDPLPKRAHGAADRSGQSQFRALPRRGPGPLRARCCHPRFSSWPSFGGWPEAAQCSDCCSRGPGWILGHCQCSAHAAGPVLCGSTDTNSESVFWLHCTSVFMGFPSTSSDLVACPLHKQQSRAGQSSEQLCRCTTPGLAWSRDPPTSARRKQQVREVRSWSTHNAGR